MRARGRSTPAPGECRKLTYRYGDRYRAGAQAGRQRVQRSGFLFAMSRPAAAAESRLLTGGTRTRGRDSTPPTSRWTSHPGLCRRHNLGSRRLPAVAAASPGAAQARDRRALSTGADERAKVLSGCARALSLSDSESGAVRYVTAAPAALTKPASAEPGGFRAGAFCVNNLTGPGARVRVTRGKVASTYKTP